MNFKRYAVVGTLMACACGVRLAPAQAQTAQAEGAPHSTQVLLAPTTQSAGDTFHRSLLFQEFNALPPGRFLVGSGTEKSTLDAVRLVAPEFGLQASMKRVSVQDQRFSEAIRVMVPNAPAEPDSDYWKIHLRADSSQPVAKGDALWLTFWARVIPEAGASAGGEVSGKMQAVVKHESGVGAGGFAEGGILELRPGGQWQQFIMPLAANQSDRPRAEFYINFKKQMLEIGGLAWVSFGSALTRDKLPAPRLNLNYPGRAPNAPWRKEAVARIQKIRTAPLQVLVVDAKGRPVRGAKVSVAMKRHAFGFGTHVPTHMFPSGTDAAGYKGENFRHRSFEAGPIGAQYRQKVRENFNIVTTGFGWRLWATPDTLRPDVLSIIEMWRKEGLQVKDHAVLYPRSDLVPDEVVKMGREEAVAALFAYTRELVSALKGKVAVWDVLNEPFSSLLFQEKFGSDRAGYYQMLADLFKEIKRLDPKSKLFLNDAGQEGEPEQRAKFLAFARELTSRGAPIDGFGAQAHSGSIDPVKYLRAFDEVTKGGQMFAISEFDVVGISKRTPETDAFEAAMLRDLLIATFSHPKADHFIMWGFWTGDHWLGNAPLYNLDWTPKPALKAWRDLIYRDWWTKRNGSTRADGKYLGRGFLGDYEITASVGGKSGTARTNLGKGGTTVKVKLAP